MHYVEEENSRKTIASANFLRQQHAWGLQQTIRGSLCLVFVMVIVAKVEEKEMRSEK